MHQARELGGYGELGNYTLLSQILWELPKAHGAHGCFQFLLWPLLTQGILRFLLWGWGCHSACYTFSQCSMLSFKLFEDNVVFPPIWQNNPRGQTKAQRASVYFWDPSSLLRKKLWEGMKLFIFVRYHVMFWHMDISCNVWTSVTMSGTSNIISLWRKCSEFFLPAFTKIHSTLPHLLSRE